MPDNDDPAILSIAGSGNLQRVLNSYEEDRYDHGLVQSIPYEGFALDTLLAGPGADWQRARIEGFIDALSQRDPDAGTGRADIAGAHAAKATLRLPEAALAESSG